MQLYSAMPYTTDTTCTTSGVGAFACPYLPSFLPSSFLYNLLQDPSGCGAPGGLLAFHAVLVRHVLLQREPAWRARPTWAAGQSIPARAYQPIGRGRPRLEAGRGWRPAEAGGRPRLEAGRGWRPAEAGGRPAHELAPAGRARGRMGRRLWAEAFHIGAWTGCPSTGSPPRTARLGRPCALPSHPRLR